MRRIILIMVWLAIALIATGPSFAKTKDIRFHLVLSVKEAQTTPSQKYSFIAHRGEKPKEIYVSQDALFSDADIMTINVIKRENSFSKKYPTLEIIFTKEGSKKLMEITKQQRRKNLAVIVGDEVISMPLIVYPLTKGYVMISSWKIATDDDAENFVKDLGLIPLIK